jgi:hypothetical protein
VRPQPSRPSDNRLRIKTLALASGIVALATAVTAIAANVSGGPPRNSGAPQQTATQQTATYAAATGSPVASPPAASPGRSGASAGPSGASPGPSVGPPRQSGAPSSGAALASHYAAQLTGFTPAASLAGTWGDGSSWSDKSTVGRATFADGKLTFSYTARHSGVDSALTDGTGGACVSVSDDGISFNEVPMAASPSVNATYPDVFSGTITVAAFMPGTYALIWGCSNSLYSTESIPIGTLNGTSIRPPQVDVYGNWIWFVTSLDYTSSTTTVHLATISGNGVLQEPGKIWHLGDVNRKVIASAQSTVMNVAGQSTRTFNGSSKVVYLEITFPTATHGLYLYCDDELNPQIGGDGALP